MDQRYQLGLVAELMCRSDHYCGFPIACLKLWIEPAILMRQIKFFYDVSNNCVGYITWAKVEEETYVRMVKDPSYILHLSEWNEGNELLIMDFMVLNGDVRRFMRESMEDLAGHGIARSFRRRADGSIRKIVTWKARPL